MEKQAVDIKKYRVELRAWYKEVKAACHCAKCGSDNKKEFHHLNPAEKVLSVAQMVHLSYPKEVIIEEMGKCIVLCEKCHRKEHRKMMLK